MCVCVCVYVCVCVCVHVHVHVCMCVCVCECVCMCLSVCVTMFDQYIHSSSSMLTVVVLAVVLGPSPDGGLTGMLSEPRNISSPSSIMSDMMDTGTGMLASSGFSVSSILFPV